MPFAAVCPVLVCGERGILMSSLFRTRADKIFDTINIEIMVIVLIIVLYPLYFVCLASFSDPYAVARGEIRFWIKGFTLEAYENVFSNKNIWIGYRNTILYTLFGTIFSLMLTLPAAYTLSKKRLLCRRVILIYFLVTMYFSGGLIPTYMTVKSLSLLNLPITLVMMGALSVYNLIVTRVFFEATIPEDIYEAAYMDGARESLVFIRIALPLAAPIIAVMALFYGVARWNDYFNALIYVSDSRLYPLQLILRGILIQSQTALAGVSSDSMDAEAIAAAARRAYMAEAMKYALIIVSSVPLLAVYPFVQKHFVKGVMIGSLKG